ncbi:hypothetical protein [Nesterenkonia pannonica]|uniref:hypothetical protein n=1 Tax=Nesterenkonia pannonica TaxID=1548602 RepID=UPI0021649C74|nr:hypothetical protein [Nesterenkonia pannonica]
MSTTARPGLSVVEDDEDHVSDGSMPAVHGARTETIAAANGSAASGSSSKAGTPIPTTGWSWGPPSRWPP